jgi:elongation factor G
MAPADLRSVRNIGIIAHIDAGKTTFTERLLYFSGAIHRMGEVHDGDAQMDYLPEERERGITITAAVTRFPWGGSEVHLVDTPGHVDFTIEVERSLRVLDGAVAIFDGVGGVEPQSEVVWRQADRYRVPRIAFVNKLDRPGAEYGRVVEQMRTKLRARAVPVTVPLGRDGDFRAVADLLTMERVDFAPGGEASRRPLDAAEEASVAPYREALVEAAADADDEAAEAWLSGSEIPLPLLLSAIRKGTVENRFFPLYAGSALRNRGVQPAMDGIVRFLPSPLDLPPQKGEDPRTKAPVERAPSPKGPFSALLFKVLSEEGRRTAFLRVYSGVLREGDEVMNGATGERERVSRIFRIHAGKRERAEEVSAGEIVCVRGIRKGGTGDTLCAPSDPVVFEPIELRRPVVSIVVEPRTVRDMDRVKELLSMAADEDPTLAWKEDEETGQVLLSGMGELHLEVLLERLSREHGLDVRTGKPQVVCRETVSEAASAEEAFEMELGERKASVSVALTVRPGERGSGGKVRRAPPLASIPAEVADAAEGGVREALYSGVLGFPVDDVDVVLDRVSFLSGVPAPAPAKVAAVKAFLAACAKGRPFLLEPVMEVEISVPDEFSGGVIGDLNARRGRVHGVERAPEGTRVSAQVPLKEMFGYVTALRSLTQGRGTATMKFSHYDRA